jgi:hypothetical protein
MRQADDTVRVASRDLSNFLACRHLTNGGGPGGGPAVDRDPVVWSVESAVALGVGTAVRSSPDIPGNREELRRTPAPGCGARASEADTVAWNYKAFK